MLKKEEEKERIKGQNASTVKAKREKKLEWTSRFALGTGVRLTEAQRCFPLPPERHGSPRPVRGREGAGKAGGREGAGEGGREGGSGGR